MKINYNNTEIDVDELRVDRYYKHINSNTLWKIHSLQPSPMGVTVDLELINEYGDVRNMELMSNMTPIFAKEGKFEEITKKEFDNKKRG